MSLRSSVFVCSIADDKRPYIYRCRSPNMEIFTCWWRPIANQDNVTYTLLERTPRECPDYVSGGINSCFFDPWSHVLLSPVETDPPSNLTYVMLNESIGEVGRSVLVSWLHPVKSLVHEELIMLVYELRYRNLAQPDNWRVMERLREPHVEFLDLPVGRYEFSVRCRSTSNKHWSVWSESIFITISGSALSDRMIKSFLLPAIPKPCIPGLEHALLKKGKIDEINQHFSSFHGYKSPQYCTETWSQVSVDTGCSH
uniref:Fibronectin type-III domain-containing protein n=1 Tax=Cyprinus carpio TaxID=7962 RepID=A0A8C2ACQ2_CYPCA